MMKIEIKIDDLQLAESRLSCPNNRPKMLQLLKTRLASAQHSSQRNRPCLAVEHRRE